MLASEKMISVGLLLLRISIGCLMLVHGIQKLTGFSTLSETFADPIGLGSQLSLILAIGAEVGCSILLILGLITRVAVIPLAFTMLVAFFLVHGNDPWNVKELAATYLSIYIVVFFTGPGRFSLDYRLWGDKSAAAESTSTTQP